MNNTTNKTGTSLTPIQRWLVICMAIAVVIGLGYWWYTTLEWEEKEIDLGYSKEAKQNDYLAAEIFLHKQGVQATTVKNLTLLDTHSWRNTKLGAQDTIIIVNGYKTLSQERYNSLYEWVENGGTLITSTQNPFIGTHTSEEDLLLKDFNIELAPEEDDEDSRDFLEQLADGFDDEESGEDEADDAQDTSTEKEKGKTKEEEKPENYYRCSLDQPPTTIEFADEEKPLEFDFSHSSQFIYYDYVEHNDDATSEDTMSSETPTIDAVVDEETQSADEPEDADETEGTDESENTDEEKDYHYDERLEHLLYFDIGEGSITITSDNSIWANRRIDCHDHAYGLWRLINPDGRVWFLINQDAPSLAAIIWRNASYGVLAGILALALWLWAKSLRFGPVLVVEQSGRRSLAEHIHASAMLLWRKQQHPHLLVVMRKEILERLAQQHPNLDQATDTQQLEFLQELTSINRTDIKQAMFADNLHHPQEFATAIAHLQTIWKQLSGSNL